MTDRFDAQLRQHLLGTANERPADGQLAAIFEQVGNTRQRRPLASWLPGFSDRVAPVRSAVRYAVIALALVLAAVAGAILAGGGPSRGSTPFEGTWTAIDPGDQSIQTLIVGPGGTPDVHYEDDFASGGTCDLEDSKHFTADGTGSVSEHRLDVSYPDGGGCGSTKVPIPFGVYYEFDAATDTLTDRDGATWTRVRGDAPPQTIPVGPSPNGSTVFEGRWIATDPGDGSTLTLVVGDGPEPVVQFQDDRSTGGVCDADEVKVFRADGVGEITGNRLVASYPDGGGCGSTTVGIGGRYDYDADTDTLVDQDLVIWTRVPTDGDPLPTLRPAPTGMPPATSAPTSSAACIDLSKGGSYTGSLGLPGFGSDASVSLTASVPSSPRISWLGDRNAFRLSDACDGDGTIGIITGTGGQPDDDTFCGSAVGQISGFADALALLDTAVGDDVSDRTDLEIDGYRAARYDITELRTCGFGLWGGTIMGLGETGSWYLVDVDGVLIAIELNRRDGNQTRRELEEARAIVETLQIDLAN